MSSSATESLRLGVSTRAPLLAAVLAAPTSLGSGDGCADEGEGDDSLSDHVDGLVE